MKNKILLILLLIVSFSFASKTDSLFQRHQLGFSITNATSIILFNRNTFGSNEDQSASAYYPFTVGNLVGTAVVPITVTYIPFYSIHFNCNYSLGLSKLIRIETGFGYLMQGLILKYLENNDPRYVISSKTYCYIDNITLPLHIKLSKAMRKGTFTSTLGPNFTFPVYQFYQTTNVEQYGVAQSSKFGHQKFDAQSISDNSSIGFDIKLGYEKQMNKQISINIGPIINVINIQYFNYLKQLQNRQISSALQSYIGLDLALNFGLKR